MMENNFDIKDFEKNKKYAALAYLIFFIPLVACPNSRYGRYHANQGLMLLIMGLAGTAINVMLSYSLSVAPRQSYLIIGLVSLYVTLFLISFCILGIINALTGKVKRIPLLGKIALIK